MPETEFKPFAPQGEALGFEVPLDCASLAWGGLWGQDCALASPICFDVGEVAPLVVRFISSVAIDSACLWEEVSSGSSFASILKQNLSLFLGIKYAYFPICVSVLTFLCVIVP